MEDKISKWEHEIALEKIDRANHRLWVVVILLIVALVGTNGAWIYYESQWEVVETSTTQTVEAQSESGDVIGIIGDNNEVGHGESESKQDN